MNTVCKEHEFIEVELAVTGDSKIVYSTLCRKCGKEKLRIDFKVKEICKEHEWIEVDWSWNGITNKRSYCRKCEINKEDTDFKIQENLSVINKQEWEDIEKEYEKFNNKYPHLLHYTSFLNWLKEKYFAPVVRINRKA